MDEPSNEWKKYAACKGMDVNLFYPRLRPGPNPPATPIPPVCFTCPVRVRCAIAGQEKDNGNGFGIWGGVSEKERNGGRLRPNSQRNPARLPRRWIKRVREEQEWGKKHLGKAVVMLVNYAVLVMMDVKMGRCEYCGGVFVKTARRKSYCGRACVLSAQARRKMLEGFEREAV